MSHEIVPLSDFVGFQSHTNILLDPNSLGFPVGLDLDKIGFDVTNGSKAAKRIGTMALVIAGYKGEEDDQQIFGTMNEDGAMTSAKSQISKAERGNLASLSIDPDLYDVCSGIRINNNTRNTDIGEIADRYNPQKQAESLDRAFKEQLQLLAVSTNRHRAKIPILDTVADAANSFILMSVLEEVVSGDTINKFFVGLLGFHVLVTTTVRNIKSSSADMNAQHSFFHSTKLDRMAISKGFIATHNFFRTI